MLGNSGKSEASGVDLSGADCPGIALIPAEPVAFANGEGAGMGPGSEGRRGCKPEVGGRSTLSSSGSPIPAAGGGLARFGVEFAGKPLGEAAWPSESGSGGRSSASGGIVIAAELFGIGIIPFGGWAPDGDSVEILAPGSGRYCSGGGSASAPPRPWFEKAVKAAAGDRKGLLRSRVRSLLGDLESPMGESFPRTIGAGGHALFAKSGSSGMPCAFLG